eukprot:2308114-Rhodomonas_salina.1
MRASFAASASVASGLRSSPTYSLVLWLRCAAPHVLWCVQCSACRTITMHNVPGRLGSTLPRDTASPPTPYAPSGPPSTGLGASHTISAPLGAYSITPDASTRHGVGDTHSIVKQSVPDAA